MKILMALLIPVVGLMANSAQAAEPAFVIPTPTLDQTAKADKQTVVLAGGCFWGVQAVFQHTKGVTSAVSGYAGGDKSTAHYETVGTGKTGHAESVAVTFDPRQISYGKILQIYFSVAHNPTELNRQGRMSARNTGQRFSMPTTNSKSSPLPTSPSSTRRKSSRTRS